MPETKNIHNTTLIRLIDFINLEYHAYFNNTLPLISTLIHSTLKIDTESSKQINLIYTKFEEFKEQLTQHLGKEKHLLFPILHEINSNKKTAVDAIDFEKIYTIILNDNKKLIPTLNEIKKLANNFEASGNYSQTLKQCFTELQKLEQNYLRYAEIEENILLQKLISIKNNLQPEIRETIFSEV